MTVVCHVTVDVVKVEGRSVSLNLCVRSNEEMIDRSCLVSDVALSGRRYLDPFDHAERNAGTSVKHLTPQKYSHAYLLCPGA